MSNEPKAGNIPSTPVSPKSDDKVRHVQFNLAHMVKNLMVAQLLSGIMRQAKNEEMAQYFLGITTGYKDWITALKIDEDTLDEIQIQLPKDTIRAEAAELAKNMLEAEAKRKRLVVGLDVHGKEAKVAKKIFDSRLKGEL